MVKIRGHSSIVKAFIKACNVKMTNWFRLLSFVLWENRITHSTVMRYMPMELIFGRKLVMAIEVVPTSNVFPSKDGLNRKELLSLRTQQLERKPKDIEVAIKRLNEQERRTKKDLIVDIDCDPEAIQNGNWVLVYASSLDNQCNTARKFAKQWFEHYVVKQVHDNATYLL